MNKRLVQFQKTLAFLLMIALFSSCNSNGNSGKDAAEQNTFLGKTLAVLPHLPTHAEQKEVEKIPLPPEEAPNILPEFMLDVEDLQTFYILYKVQFSDESFGVLFEKNGDEYFLMLLDENQSPTNVIALLFDFPVWTGDALFSGSYNKEYGTINVELLTREGDDITNLVEEYVCDETDNSKFGPLKLASWKTLSTEQIIDEVSKNFKSAHDLDAESIKGSLFVDHQNPDLIIVDGSITKWKAQDGTEAVLVITTTDEQTEPLLHVLEKTPVEDFWSYVAFSEASLLKQHNYKTFEFNAPVVQDGQVIISGRVHGQMEAEGGDGFYFLNETFSETVVFDTVSREYFLQTEMSDSAPLDTISIDPFQVIVFRPTEAEFKKLEAEDPEGGIYEVDADFGHYVADFLETLNDGNIQVKTVSERILSYSTKEGIQYLDRLKNEHHPYGIIFNKEGCDPQIEFGVMGAGMTEAYEKYLEKCP